MVIMHSYLRIQVVLFDHRTSMAKLQFNNLTQKTYKIQFRFIKTIQLRLS